MFQLSSRTDIIKVSKSSATDSSPYYYYIWVEIGNRRYDVTRAEFESLLGHYIPELLVRREDCEFTVDDLARFGLKHSFKDTGPHNTMSEQEWDTPQMYLWKTGVYFGVDASTERSNPIDLYTLKIMGMGNSTTHSVVDGVFRFGGKDLHYAYMAIHAFCSKDFGRVCKMTFGLDREQNPGGAKFLQPQLEKFLFQDRSCMCIQAAYCNAVNLLGHTSLAKEYWNDFMKASLHYEVSGALPHYIRDFRDARKRLDERRVKITRQGGTSPTLSAALAFKSDCSAKCLSGRNQDPTVQQQHQQQQQKPTIVADGTALRSVRFSLSL